MPLTAKGEKILSGMEKEYGKEKGKQVFYASKNKGTITGVDSNDKPHVSVTEAKIRDDSTEAECDAMVITRHDMSDEGWEKLKGLVGKWIDEEKGEAEHKNDASDVIYATKTNPPKVGDVVKHSGKKYKVTAVNENKDGYHAVHGEEVKKDEFGEKLDDCLTKMDEFREEYKIKTAANKHMLEGKVRTTKDIGKPLQAARAEHSLSELDSKLDSALEKLDSLKNDADEKQKRIKELSARISSLKSQFVNGQVPKDEIHSKEQEITQLLEERHSLDRIYPRGPFRWK